MWSKFVLGAAVPDDDAADVAEEEEILDPEEEEGLYDEGEAMTPQFSGNSNVLGNRFAYMGQMANRIMAQVAPTLSADEDLDDDGNETEPNAWENEDDVLDFSASEHRDHVEMAPLETPVEETIAAIHDIPIPTIDTTEVVWDEDDYHQLDLSNSERAPVVLKESTEIAIPDVPAASEELYPTDLLPIASNVVAMAMVDHTPHHYKDPNDDEATGGAVPGGTPSLATLAESEDLTRDTGCVGGVNPAGLDSVAENVSVYVHNDEDDEDVYDLENEHSFGPVVDHTPTKAVIPLHRCSSLAVQGARETTFHSSHNMDDTAFSGSDAGWADDTTFDESSLANFSEKKIPPPVLTAEEANVVDLTPATAVEKDIEVPTDVTALSVRALASLGETVDMEPDDGKEMDEQHAFGLVVDITPLAADTDGDAAPTVTHSDVTVDGGNTILSMAVSPGEIQGDFEDDEAMEDTCYGDSTVGGGFTDDYDENEAPGEGWASEDEDVVLATMDDDDDDDKIAQPDIPPLIAMNEPKRTTFSPMLTSFESPLVDHTPSELPDTVSIIDSQPINPSVIALAMSEDETRDTGIGSDDDADVYDDENEEQFGPVVDHTPQQTPRIVHSEVREVVGIFLPTLTQEDDDALLDLTSFNGSGGETDAAAVGVGGVDDWGEDDEDDEEEEPDTAELSVVVPNEDCVALVDHTPSEIDSPAKDRAGGDQSVQVQGSIATNTVDTVDEGDSMVDANIVYGPVVDQTPTTPGTSAAVFLSRSDSVMVQGNDDVDSMDTTVVGGGSRIDYGDETLDGEAPSAHLDSEEKDEDQVVDFIPTRLESRHGDGSTFVAADPSEVLSEVDDLVPEEQNFGPVVDLTPLAHDVEEVFGVPSGEGSTVVFAPPSIAADDLDQEDEGDADTEQAGWNPNLDEEPNPQSGNDEPHVVNRMNQQLVDFLPPPNNIGEPSVGDATREGLSEMTVAGAQSLLQVGDPTEDDFGPVVDQIPSVVRSHESTSTQLSPSECRALEKDDRVIEGDDSSSTQPKANVVVDHLPLMERKRPLDSTATRGKSFLSEEYEEEEEDASKFGPVVDQLPTSRSSLAPSHGGSTVDALATVSEVNSDDEEGDAWDDFDVDFEASLGGVSEANSRHVSTSSGLLRPVVLTSSQSIDTDRSVRFDPSINKNSNDDQQKVNSDILVGVPDDTQYYDTGGLSALSVALSETKMGIARSLSARPYETTDKSFAEADTPPSTPYRRPEGTNLADQIETEEGMSLPFLSNSECFACESAQTASCPCVQRLIVSNIQSGAVLGSMETPDGSVIKIDFFQLLQDEVTRRRLVEVELESLKEKYQIPMSTRRSMDAELKAEVLEFRRIQDESSRKAVAAENESAVLRETNAKLMSEIKASKDLLLSLETTQSSYTAKQSALEAEVRSLKLSLSTATSGDDVVLVENEVAFLQCQLATKSGECSELKSKLTQLEDLIQAVTTSFAERSDEAAERSLSLEETIASVKAQLTESESLLKTTQFARVDLEGKLKALDVEVDSLRSASKQVASLQIQHERDLQQQYNLLDAKSSDIRSLESALSTIREEKSQILADLTQQRALAEQSEHLANELIAVAKERDLLENALNESKDAMLSLQKVIEEHGIERQKLDSTLAAEKSSLTEELKIFRESLTSKQNEKILLLNHVEELSHNNSELTRRLSELEESLRASQDVTDQAKLDLLSRLEHENSALKIDLIEASSSREKLVSELRIVSAKLDEMRANLDRMEGESKEHASQSAELADEVARLSELSDLLVEERLSLVVKIDEANSRCHEWEMKYMSSLKEFEETVKRLSKEYDKDIADLKQKDERLRDELLRLQEAESHHAAALEEIEGISQSESVQYGDTIAALNSERDELRKQLSCMENWKHQHGQPLSGDTVGDLTLETEFADLQREHSAALNEIRLAHESHRLLEEKCNNMEKETLALKRDLAEQERTYDQLRLEVSRSAEVAQQQTKCSALTADIEQLRASSDLLASEGGQREALLLENNRLIKENEEMLIQFGLLKLHMDQNEESERELHAELNAMRLASLEQNSAYAKELEHIRSSHVSLQEQLEAVTAERDVWVTERETLTEELISRNETMSQLEHRNHDLDLQLQQTVSYLKISEAKLSEQNPMLSLLKESEKQIQALESTLNEKVAQITSLEQRVENMNSSSMNGDILQDDWLSIRQQVDVLNQALQSTRDRLAVREADVDCLRADLRELRHHPTPVDIAFSSVVASSDSSSLVARAAKLRRSESIREAALQRLESERDASIEALRRLSESVSKYYNNKK
jgi:hypothetical protein